METIDENQDYDPNEKQEDVMGSLSPVALSTNNNNTVKKRRVIKPSRPPGRSKKVKQQMMNNQNTTDSSNDKNSASKIGNSSDATDTLSPAESQNVDATENGSTRVNSGNESSRDSQTGMVSAGVPGAANQKKAIESEQQVLDQGADPAQPRLARFCSKFKAKRPQHAHAQQAKNNNNINEPAAESEKQSTPRSQNKENSALGDSSTSGGAPMVKFVNGEIVLQESSMVLHGFDKPPDEDDREYQVVEEEDQLGILGSTYTSFRNNDKNGHNPFGKSKVWTVPETQLFYEALRQVGVDFCTMESFFASSTKRTRKMLKQKYKKECIHNPLLIEAALQPHCRKEIDLSVFDVTADDVANVPRPTDPKPMESIEQQTDPESSAQLPSATATAGKRENNFGDDDEIRVVEEDDSHPPQQMMPTTTPAASSVSTTGKLFNFFWEDQDKETEESGERPMATQRPDLGYDEHGEMDPALEEVGEDGEHGSFVSISLVSTNANNKKKSKKPKFRSLKKGK